MCGAELGGGERDDEVGNGEHGVWDGRGRDGGRGGGLGAAPGAEGDRGCAADDLMEPVAVPAPTPTSATRVPARTPTSLLLLKSSVCTKKRNASYP